MLLVGCSVQRVTPTDSLTEHIAVAAREQEGVEYRDARQVVLCDLDEDGQAEMIVLYFIAGPFGHNDADAYLAVFRRYDAKRWYVIHTSYIGNRGWRHIVGMKIAKRAVLIDALEFQGGEPLSSPSLRVTLKVTMPRWETVVVKRSLNGLVTPPNNGDSDAPQSHA
jgi:hypothetical protein